MQTIVTTRLGWDEQSERPGTSGPDAARPTQSVAARVAVSVQRCVPVTAVRDMPLSRLDLGAVTGGAASALEQPAEPPGSERAWRRSLASTGLCLTTQPFPALMLVPTRTTASPERHPPEPLAPKPGSAEGSAPASPAGPRAAPAAPMQIEVEAARAPRVIFRKAALDAHYDSDTTLGAADPKAGAWGALLVITSLVFALFSAAALLTVEVTVRAPGALRAPNGLRSVASTLAGAVTEVLVVAGDDVNAGQVVARLEETELRATLTLREHELAVVERDASAAAHLDETLLLEGTAALRHQQTALRRHSGINRAQLQQRAQHFSDSRQLLQEGVASASDALAVHESVQAAAESMVVVEAQAAALELSIADRRRDWKQRELERASTISRAMAAVEEARSLLAMTEIHSPAPGRVESLLVNPGTVVQAGTIIAQIVPKDAPCAIVAFLPSRETAFVGLGTEANVEVESLPVNEFGMARARVTRISADIAKAEEIALAFGEPLPGSFVRVELTLINDAAQAKMAPQLRSGERVTVRLHRREQRIISLIFEFLRKWLEQ